MNYYKEIETLKENYRNDLQNPEPDWPPNVKEALNRKQNNLYEENLTVGLVKDACNITSKNFASRFAYYVGKTPNQYYNYHRIEVAKLILSKDELKSIKISDIAYAAGFSKPSTFSKCFKRETGMPPSRWRKKT